MTSALHGQIKFSQGMKAGFRPSLYAMTPVDPNEQLGKDWQPLTQWLGVGVDDEHRGQLLTFSSASWSAWSAFATLIGPFLRKRKTEFPIVVLGSRPRNDVNGNVDPTFAIVDWAPRESFGDLAPPELTTDELAALPAPERDDEPDDDGGAPEARGGEYAPADDSDIPF